VSAGGGSRKGGNAWGKMKPHKNLKRLRTEEGAKEERGFRKTSADYIEKERENNKEGKEKKEREGVGFD